MDRKFKNITVIDNKELFDVMAVYEEKLINEATTNSALVQQDADNEYTREIGRVGVLLADYETEYMSFNRLKFKSPLVLCEEDM